MGENVVVTDMAQGVDCWMCEEGEPHVHGPIIDSADAAFEKLTAWLKDQA